MEEEIPSGTSEGFGRFSRIPFSMIELHIDIYEIKENIYSFESYTILGKEVQKCEWILFNSAKPKRTTKGVAKKLYILRHFFSTTVKRH